MAILMASALTLPALSQAHMNYAFEVDCDHLEVEGNCVRTTHYGNDHTCRITAKKNVKISVSYFEVEDHSDCAWDYLEAGGLKYCGNTETPDGLRVSEGEELLWSTDYSVTDRGWEICASEEWKDETIVEIRSNGVNGGCLTAEELKDEGKVGITACSISNRSQQWMFLSTGQIQSALGDYCLLDFEPNTGHGQLLLAECDPSNNKQLFTYNAEHGQIKATQGICLDQPHWGDDRVHMWPCALDEDADPVAFRNQKWLISETGVSDYEFTTTDCSEGFEHITNAEDCVLAAVHTGKKDIDFDASNDHFTLVHYHRNDLEPTCLMHTGHGRDQISLETGRTIGTVHQPTCSDFGFAGCFCKRKEAEYIKVEDTFVLWKECPHSTTDFCVSDDYDECVLEAKDACNTSSDCVGVTVYKLDLQSKRPFHLYTDQECNGDQENDDYHWDFYEKQGEPMSSDNLPLTTTGGNFKFSVLTRIKEDWVVDDFHSGLGHILTQHSGAFFFHRATAPNEDKVEFWFSTVDNVGAWGRGGSTVRSNEHLVPGEWYTVTVKKTADQVCIQLDNNEKNCATRTVPAEQFKMKTPRAFHTDHDGRMETVLYRDLGMSVVVKHTNHPWGYPGRYFYFEREDWKAMTGDASVDGTYVVTQLGSHRWTGEVVVWDNYNGVHGRRVEGRADGQWATGDVIKLAPAQRRLEESLELKAPEPELLVAAAPLL